MGDTTVTALISVGGALLGALIGSVTGYLTARHQFRSTVIATSRQAWISSLREALAEYQVSITAIGSSFEIPTRDLAARQQLHERAASLTYKIKLFLNPAEADHLDLLKCVESAYESLGVALKTRDHSQTVSHIWRVTELGQRVLKREWEKVKAGE